MANRVDGAALRADDADARSEAARLMGSVRSERKAEAARRNAQRAGRRVLPLSDIHCNCGAGSKIEGHKSTCMRGRAIKRRIAKGLPLK